MGKYIDCALCTFLPRDRSSTTVDLIQLDAEEKRTIAERLSEEELAVFDLLTKPEPQLTDEEKDAVKRVARDLLATLKREKLVLDWRKRQQSRAQVRTTIETMLDQGLPATYTAELYQRKCDAVYQHVFDSYYGQGRSIYGPAASHVLTTGYTLDEKPSMARSVSRADPRRRPQRGKQSPERHPPHRACRRHRAWRPVDHCRRDATRRSPAARAR
jgi:Domain of unknown function (DUF3387)